MTWLIVADVVAGVVFAVAVVVVVGHAIRGSLWLKTDVSAGECEDDLL